MGIVNVTPDSFSDGGKYAGESAVSHGLALLEAGTDILDIGGESTRPGAAAVSEAEEIARVIPVIAGLRAKTQAHISIDTMKPAVAKAAIEVGANIWNDVAALTAPGALEMAGKLKVPVVLMHMQGEPRTMQQAPHYENVLEEVGAFLRERALAARAAGVSHLWIDPGIGFGKTIAHNLTLLSGLETLKKMTGERVLFGASRKSMIQMIDGAKSAPEDRIGGSLALALIAAQNGADIIRVHDVRETAQALRVLRAAEGVK
ncbi:MAG: dihydropteroate synthase [Caulobacterales bacterium]